MVIKGLVRKVLVKKTGNEGWGNKGSGNKCSGNKGIGKGKSKKKSESDHSNMSMEDLWKEGRNGQDSEKDTTDKGKVQTSFAGTMMKIWNLLSKSKDCSTDENENTDFDSSRSGKCSRKLKNVENEENDEQVDNPLEDEAVPETGERDRVNEDEEDVYSSVENKHKKKKDKKKKKKKKGVSGRK